MSDLIEMPTVVSKGVLLEQDAVRILDRRTFPLKTEFVECRNVEEVAQAIEQMVTQSSGPYFAASAGFVLAAREAEKLRDTNDRRSILSDAGARLIKTRPTNNNIRDVTTRLMFEAEAIVEQDGLAEKVEQLARQAWADQREHSRKLGVNTASLIEDGDTLLTHCWAESGIVDALSEVLKSGKSVKVVCSETRPYLQGARLTAHSVAEMGIDATVITDNMGAHAMERGMVSKLVTAADRVTLSGHVINKVGTLQLAIAAHHFGLPFIAMVRFPDAKASTPDDVGMEERDGNDTLQCLGMRTASPLAKGWYPAFDVTPPHLVSAIATTEGVYAPIAVHNRFSEKPAA